jgi:hypothetical protein
LISPHKNWPFHVDDRAIEDWMVKTCNCVKWIVKKNAFAGVEGSVITYFPTLVDACGSKVWKPSAPELKTFYEDFCGCPSDVSFICMSPWEVLEVSEFLRVNVPESPMNREIVTDIWVNCLPTFSLIRGVQESIFDQRDTAKVLSYGWPDVTRSHVPRVQTVTRCSSAIVRSVLAGCYHVIGKEDNFGNSYQPLGGCLFDVVDVCLFDDMAKFSNELIESFSSSRPASVKEVLHLMLEVSLDFFVEISSILEDPCLSIEKTRQLMCRANSSAFDVETILSSSGDLALAQNALKNLIQAFADGHHVLGNSRKVETFDQCEAVAKCTITIVNNLLKYPDHVAPLSPNRRWRDDKLWGNELCLPRALVDQLKWKSYCQDLSEFISAASFCGTEKNTEFPNGRWLDSSHHRSVAFQCIETLLFFACVTVFNTGILTALENTLPSRFKILRRSNLGNKDIPHMASLSIQKFRTEIAILKHIKPLIYPQPPTQTKLMDIAVAKTSTKTSLRRRSQNLSGVGIGIVIPNSGKSDVSDQQTVAPGLRVLHDVQGLEPKAQLVSDVLSEDCRC